MKGDDVVCFTFNEENESHGHIITNALPRDSGAAEEIRTTRRGMVINDLSSRKKKTRSNAVWI